MELFVSALSVSLGHPSHPTHRVTQPVVAAAIYYSECRHTRTPHAALRLCRTQSRANSCMKCISQIGFSPEMSAHNLVIKSRQMVGRWMVNMQLGHE